MGNGFKYMEHMKQFALFLYRHSTEGTVMSDYQEPVPVAVKETMSTMTDMGCGMLSEYDMLFKSRCFLVHTIALGAIMITYNSCGFNKLFSKIYDE